MHQDHPRATRLGAVLQDAAQGALQPQRHQPRHRWVGRGSAQLPRCPRHFEDQYSPALPPDGQASHYTNPALNPHFSTLSTPAPQTSAAELISLALAEGVCVTEVYVDTVGDPEHYQKKLSGLFSHRTPAIKVRHRLRRLPSAFDS